MARYEEHVTPGMIAAVPSHGNEHMASEIMAVGPIQLEDLDLDLDLVTGVAAGDNGGIGNSGGGGGDDTNSAAADGTGEEAEEHMDNAMEVIRVRMPAKVKLRQGLREVVLIKCLD